MTTMASRLQTQDAPATPQLTIGWREVIALPEWGIMRVRAKIDTGARTSAIHVHEIQELEDGRLRFEVVVRERPKRKSVWIEAELMRESEVKPSSGVCQRRQVVETVMQLGPVQRRIELSLVCRKGMLCRMLVGRTALDGDFIVDPSRLYVVSNSSIKRRTPNKETP